MANSPQAIKRARQADKRRLHNDALESEMRTYIKAIRAAVNSGNKDEAASALKKANQKIDRLAGNGVIHPNRGARLKSRLNTLVKTLTDNP